MDYITRNEEIKIQCFIKTGHYFHVQFFINGLLIRDALSQTKAELMEAFGINSETFDQFIKNN